MRTAAAKWLFVGTVSGLLVVSATTRVSQYLVNAFAVPKGAILALMVLLLCAFAYVASGVAISYGAPRMVWLAAPIQTVAAAFGFCAVYVASAPILQAAVRLGETPPMPYPLLSQPAGLLAALLSHSAVAAAAYVSSTRGWPEARVPGSPPSRLWSVGAYLLAALFVIDVISGVLTVLTIRSLQ